MAVGLPVLKSSSNCAGDRSSNGIYCLNLRRRPVSSRENPLSSIPLGVIKGDLGSGRKLSFGRPVVCACEVRTDIIADPLESQPAESESEREHDKVTDK